MSARIAWSRVVAEGIAIVVSILLAFGIQAWWEDRQDRVLEAEYLTALRADFQSTLDWLNYGIDVNLRKERHILELEELMVRSSDERIDTAATAYSLALLTFHPVLPVPRATFDDLTGTGNLRVLKDGQLRRRLVDFYLWVETFSVHEKAMVDRSGVLKGVIDGLLPPALLGEVAGLGWSGGPDAWESFDKLEIPESLSAEAARADLLRRIREDPDLSSGLSVAMDDIYLQRRQYELVGDRARSVLAALEEAVR